MHTVAGIRIYAGLVGAASDNGAGASVNIAPGYHGVPGFCTPGTRKFSFFSFLGWMRALRFQVGFQVGFRHEATLFLPNTKRAAKTAHKKRQVAIPLAGQY